MFGPTYLLLFFIYVRHKVILATKPAEKTHHSLDEWYKWACWSKKPFKLTIGFSQNQLKLHFFYQQSLKAWLVNEQVGQQLEMGLIANTKA